MGLYTVDEAQMLITILSRTQGEARYWRNVWRETFLFGGDDGNPRPLTGGAVKNILLVLNNTTDVLNIDTIYRLQCTEDGIT